MPQTVWTKAEKAWYRRFGRNVATARTEAGLSQKELGKAIKRSRVSISNIERGAQGVKLHNLMPLCQALGAAPERLLPV